MPRRVHIINTNYTKMAQAVADAKPGEMIYLDPNDPWSTTAYGDTILQYMRDRGDYRKYVNRSGLPKLYVNRKGV